MEIHSFRKSVPITTHSGNKLMQWIKGDTLYKTFVLWENRQSLAWNEIEKHVFNLKK